MTVVWRVVANARDGRTGAPGEGNRSTWAVVLARNLRGARRKAFPCRGSRETEDGRVLPRSSRTVVAFSLAHRKTRANPHPGISARGGSGEHLMGGVRHMTSRLVSVAAHGSRPSTQVEHVAHGQEGPMNRRPGMRRS